MNKIEELELIMEKIQYVNEIVFTDIDEWNQLDEKSQKQIIKEWSIINNPDYQISLVYDNFMNSTEPVTALTISKKLNLTIVTSKILEKRYLDLNEKDPSQFERDLYSLKLKQIICSKIKEQNITGNRKKLLIEETEEICKLGNPKTMVLAYKITNMLRQKKFCWFIRGNLSSSLVAYHLGIHDIDCYKFGIDYHICHGADFKTNFSIDITVSQVHQFEILKNVEEKVLKEFKIYKLFFRTKSTNKPVLHPCRMAIPLEEIDNSFVVQIDDINGGKRLCISDEDAVVKLSKKLLRINISATFSLNFFEKMNKLYPIYKIDINDVSYLNVALKQKNRFVFGGDNFELLNKIDRPLNFDDYISWLGYLLNKRFKDVDFNEPRNYLNSRDELLEILKQVIDHKKALVLANSVKHGFDYRMLSEDELIKFDRNMQFAIKNTEYLWPKACLIEQIYNKIRLAYYFINYPEESFAYYFRNYFDVSVSKHMLRTKNECERLRLYTYLCTYHFYSFERYIGIFFVINGELIVYKEKLIKTTGDFIDVEKGHFDLFNSLPISSDFEYSMFPRGRILYNNKESCFYLYADKTILKNKSLLEKISKEFNLPMYNIKFKSDEHYQILKY